MLPSPRLLPLVLLGSLLAACGGGGPGGKPSDPAPQTASQFAAYCANPRSGIDPASGKPYPDRAGSVDLEKSWVRNWIDETYLWYREVPSLAVALYPTPVEYFDDLKTPKITASGKPKDAYHFSVPSDEWQALSQSAESLGYGMQVMLLDPEPPRTAVVAYTEAGSPAARAGIRRGDEIVEADGVDFVEGNDVDTLNAALFPQRAGETHRFKLFARHSFGYRSVVLKAARVRSDPVPQVQLISTDDGTKVGYLRFQDHSAPAEAALIEAVHKLKSKGPLDDLVLDLRYNGGGYLGIASQLAYMIAGPVRSAGKTFMQQVDNGKNPFHQSPKEARIPFISKTAGYSVPADRALPTLDLRRVYILTGPGTCSASEAIINGLRGIDVEVVQIGETTCGKPYGFRPADNCGTTYFALQFAGRNAKGFGAYADGFVPNGKGGAGVPGCTAYDDFRFDLGNRDEGLLSTAMQYRENGSCELGYGLATPRSKARLLRSPLRESAVIP